MDTKEHKDRKVKKGRKENMYMSGNQYKRGNKGREDNKEIKEERDRKETAMEHLKQPKEPWGHQLTDNLAYNVRYHKILDLYLINTFNRT